MAAVVGLVGELKGISNSSNLRSAPFMGMLSLMALISSKNWVLLVPVMFVNFL